MCFYVINSPSAAHALGSVSIRMHASTYTAREARPREERTNGGGTISCVEGWASKRDAHVDTRLLKDQNTKEVHAQAEDDPDQTSAGAYEAHRNDNNNNSVEYRRTKHAH